ncbi:hypothetical protein AMJ52_02345 [candidate division TA06 bacterium DG_78]|uniref:Putative zinc-finger domain-containing protein n=1 Tax=candidate division TA06 bacterium DG_78 TaxID=1703772 RepID=A0A0S7YH61_UNCT6|nr:MAG: hypothetical protein AMJ52_02345 [candidate division TA06 bacterium DG_78]
MKCSEIKRKLSAFLDGEVSEEEKQIILEHLNTCDRCRKEFEALSQVSEVLEVIDEIQVSPFFVTHLKQRITGQKAKSRVHIPFVEWIRRAAVPITAVVLIIISFLVGSNLGKVLHREHAENMAESETDITSVLGVSSLAEFPEGSLGWAYDNLLIGGE